MYRCDPSVCRFLPPALCHWFFVFVFRACLFFMFSVLRTFFVCSSFFSAVFFAVSSVLVDRSSPFACFVLLCFVSFVLFVLCVLLVRLSCFVLALCSFVLRFLFLVLINSFLVLCSIFFVRFCLFSCCHRGRTGPGRNKQTNKPAETKGGHR